MARRKPGDAIEKLIADTPLRVPLDPDVMVKAFRRWDEEIGAAKGKK